MTSRRSLAAFTLALLTSVASPAFADAPTLRFSATAPGTVIGTGNTLGLSKESGKNGPGTADSIGTFISVSAASVDDDPADGTLPWPGGTTNDWTKNGSTAKLVLPVESEILYAELVWGGSYDYGGELTAPADLETPVTISAGGASMTIAPDAATALTIADTGHSSGGGTFAANYYMRSADVTAFVKQTRDGVYAVGGVPATQPESINSLSAAGWTLVVAVNDSTAPVRNLSVFVGGSFVDERSGQNYDVDGLCTPTAGPVKGSVVISAIEGDANLPGDQLLIGATEAGPFKNLSGPNNPEQNFFSSQINGADGNVDPAGSFGTENQDAANGANVSGGRQGWDVTTVSLSSQAGQLANNQTSAVLQTITTGDSYVPIVAAFAIDVNAPDFTGASSKISASPGTVGVGDDVSLTLDVKNAGAVEASGAAFKMSLPTGLSLKSFKMQGHAGDIDGNPVDGTKLATGVPAGDIGANATRHVDLVVHVDHAPAGPVIGFRADWNYQFDVCAGGNPTPETFSQFAHVNFDGNASGAGGAAGSTGSHGSTSNGAGGGNHGGGGGGDAGGGFDVGGTSDDGGCGCEMPGSTSTTLLPGLALAALGLVGARRRVRR